MCIYYYYCIYSFAKAAVVQSIVVNYYFLLELFYIMLHSIPEHRALLSVELPFCVTPLHSVVLEKVLPEQDSAVSTNTGEKVKANEHDEPFRKQLGEQKRRRSTSSRKSEIFCSVADRHRIQSFLPTPELFQCLTSEESECGGPTTNSGGSAEASAPPFSVMNENKAEGHRSSCLTSSSSLSPESGVSDETGVNRKYLHTNSKWKNNEGPYSFFIAHNRLYRPDPVWSTWRGTDWASSEDEEEGLNEDREEEEKENETERANSFFSPFPNKGFGKVNPKFTVSDSFGSSTSRGRLKRSVSGSTEVGEHTVENEEDPFSGESIFPSSTPQLLLNGYYRNDILLRVRQRYKVRCFRSRKTGKIIREEEIETDEDEGKEKEDKVKDCEKDYLRPLVQQPAAGIEYQPSGQLCSPSTSLHSRAPRFETTVLGVVSREVEIGRPADFAFSLFSKDEKERAPFSCSGDLFPPSHFLSAKTPFELKYEMGLQVNTAVLTAEQLSKPLGCLSQSIKENMATEKGVDEDDGSQPLFLSGTLDTRSESKKESTDSKGDLIDLFHVPLLTVHPDAGDAGIPPPPLPRQIEFLRRVGSSPTGLDPDDPEEVKVVARLLEVRPVWSIKDLQEAAMQSGLCPRGHFTKRVIHALTYVIPIGAFNRLRIRLGFNPYSSPLNMLYQRVAVRLHRRSAVGMLLRDISRSEKIEQVIHELRTHKNNPIPHPWTIGMSHTARITKSGDCTSSDPHLIIETELRSVDFPAHSSRGNDVEVLDVSGVPRCSLREHFCRTILHGQLNIYFQLIDSIESHAHQRIVTQALRRWRAKGEGEKNDDEKNTTPLSSPEKASSGVSTGSKSEIRLPLSKRKEPSGWLAEQEYSKALSTYTSALVHFIEEEAIPLLKEMLKVDEAAPSEKSGISQDEARDSLKVENRPQSDRIVPSFLGGEHHLFNAPVLEHTPAPKIVLTNFFPGDKVMTEPQNSIIGRPGGLSKKSLSEKSDEKKEVPGRFLEINEDWESFEDENAIGISGNTQEVDDRSSSTSSSSSSFGSNHASRNSSMGSDIDDFSSDESTH